MKMTLFISPSAKPGVRIAHYVTSDDDVTDADIIKFLVNFRNVDPAKLTSGGVHQWPGKLVDKEKLVMSRHFE